MLTAGAGTMVIAALALCACSSSQTSHTAGDRDAAPPDAGSKGPRIGDHCEPSQGWQPLDAGIRSRDAGVVRTAADLPPIGAGYCGQWRDAPDGYFTARCTRDRDCPDGARCGLGSGWCVAPCDSNADCVPPASCHLSAAAAAWYCQVTGGPFGRGDRDAGASDDCENPCGLFDTCCEQQCFDLANDPEHCGHCTRACGADAPFCSGGECIAPVCAMSCGEAACCGGACCALGETCCEMYSATGAQPICIALDEGQRCPSGCHDCE